MEPLLVLFVIMAITTLLGAAANTFGVDTRDGFGDDAAPKGLW
jgi:hypothetical protein